MNALKERIRKGERLCGTHISMGEMYAADIFARVGFDYVWIDTEHSGMDYGKLLNCVTVLRAHKVPVIVRTQMSNINNTKRILEMGVDGIIFPQVDTPEYADECMRSTLYPPYGNRGFGPIGATNYGLDGDAEYIADSVDNLCRFVQIESVRAIENLPKLVENPYIDGFIFGPCDLSGSVGKLGDLYCEKELALIREAIGFLKSKGKYTGLSSGSTDAGVQKLWFEMGVGMLSAGVDFGYVAEGAKRNALQMKKIAESLK